MTTAIILQPTFHANASSKMQARVDNNISVTSGKFLIAPVTTSTSPNPLVGLTLNMSKKNDYFFLRNFGTLTLASVNMTQSMNNSTIRYCVNQLFLNNNYTKCADNSNAILVGTGIQLGRFQLAQPLVPGAAYQFSALSTTSGSNLVSVSATQSDLLNPFGTISNQ